MTDDKLPYCPVYKSTLCISRLLYLFKKALHSLRILVEYLITADEPVKISVSSQHCRRKIRWKCVKRWNGVGNKIYIVQFIFHRTVSFYPTKSFLFHHFLLSPWPHDRSWLPSFIYLHAHTKLINHHGVSNYNKKHVFIIHK